MFTAAFGVNPKLADAFGEDEKFLRYILLEKPLTPEAKSVLEQDKDVEIANGAALGKLTLRAKVPGWKLDKWFLDEGHYRYEGNVFYIHTKVLLIDPLSEDPLVVSGSANFSRNSLVNNDENMLIIRGDTRVADIYMTEFDRIFRHFYFRNVANELALKGSEGEPAIFLDPTDAWVKQHFGSKRMKSKRRKLFFPASKN
jgi:phosphatidylserine/phosphatidylglycerophosphate/cardiolipin synthase-like enzyme